MGANTKSWVDDNGRVRYLHDLDPGYRLVYEPLSWQHARLQETASGYGAKLTTMQMAVLTDGRKRRVYITQYSNAGTAWITVNGIRYVVIDRAEGLL